MRLIALGGTNLTTLCFYSGPAKTTYIAVVVGVVGTLALLSLGICLDIWRRRRRSLARQLEEDQGPRDPSFYARFPPLPGEPDNTLMQEHQSHSPPTRPTPPLHASVALPEAVYAGHVQSTRPITSSGTMQDSDDEKSPPSPGKEKPLFDEPQFISNAGAPIGPQEKSGLTPTS